jgi:hypothetical protein
MPTKIFSIEKLSAAGVNAGDVLIDSRLCRGFGDVEITGRLRDEFNNERVTLVVEGRAFAFRAEQEVEVAGTILRDGEYGTRAVEIDGLAKVPVTLFRGPAPLYEG